MYHIFHCPFKKSTLFEGNRNKAESISTFLQLLVGHWLGSCVTDVLSFPTIWINKHFTSVPSFCLTDLAFKKGKGLSNSCIF